LRVEVNSKSDCKREVRIEVEADELKDEYAAVCSRYQRQARVPGFRQGKTPLPILLQRFKNNIREDFVESAVRKHLLQAIEAEKLSPLDPPHVHDLAYNEGQPLRFTAEFEVLPKLTISNYTGLEIDRIPVEVKEEEVDAAIEGARQRMAQFVPISGRAVEKGDFAVISYRGKFTDPGRKDLEAKDVYCEVGSEKTLPEFSENLLGAQVGDKKVFSIKYPEDFPNKDLTGTEIQYEIEVTDIRQKQVPELNDDFARDAGQYASLDEMRQKVREEITARKEKTAQADMQEKLVGLIIEQNPFDVPEAMVKKQAENRLNDYVRSLAMRGIHPQTLDINWSEFQQRQKELAATDVRVALVLEHIAEQESISVSDEEVDFDIARRAEEAHQSFEALKSRLTKDGSTDKIRDRIRNKKSLDLLLSRATLKDPQGLTIQP
jgi:trigger factor